MSFCGRLAANGSGSPVSNSLNFVCYMYRIGKSDLPHHSPQCVKQLIFSNHRAEDTLANKQKAIFINDILIHMHSHNFFNSTQFKALLNFVCCDNIEIYLFVCISYVQRVRSINYYYYYFYFFHPILEQTRSR